ncbi:MAG: penicillin acylase family protein [Solirubrobacteraceae bacterium]
MGERLWRQRIGGLVCALALLGLGAPAVSSARVIQAQSILPPGQSGFVSLAGLASGTGSPHLYDQTQPFVDFRWKPATFNQPGRTETPKPGVRIVRDGYGVPSVTAPSELDMWWGAGYAIAQDRLFELELFRRATSGRLAELIGRSRVADDAIVRQNFYTPAELDAQAARLPAPLRARFDAYRDGINAWIAHVRTTPADLPGEYPAVNASLTDWTTRDSLAIGAYLARTIGSNADPEGVELANMRAVQLSGPRVLERLVPLRTPHALPTIPAVDRRFSSQPGRTLRQERAAFARSVRFVGALPFPRVSESAGPNPPAVASGHRDILPRTLGPGGSFMYAVRRRSDKHAILVNGPQLGFASPELLVEIELHAPGIDLRGMTAPGAPIIGAGHNGFVAWGVTTGASDADDLYAEQLVPGQPERYRFRGEVLNMDCRDEPIVFRSPPSDLLKILGGKVPPTPESGTQTRRVCRTVHGPVQFRAGNIAYARRYAIWNRELETLEGLADLNAARDISGVDAALRKVTWNENVMAIDSGGNIGFWHPGLLPLRPRGYDERLPYPGTGEAEWRGLLDRRTQIPAIINPRQGWLANWNNLPAEGWTSGDGTARKRLDGDFFRVGWLMWLTRRLAAAPTFEGAQALIRQSGTVAQQFPRTRVKLASAMRGATAPQRLVMQTLLNWDGSYDRTAADGTVDPGVAAWGAFRAAAGRFATAPYGPGAKFLADEGALAGLYPDYDMSAGYHYFDATHFESFGLRVLSPAGYRAAAGAAHEALVARFKSADPARWREPRRYYPIAAQGAASPPDLPFFDRGTYEQIIETGP